MKFSSFLDIKNKKTIQQLNILKNILSGYFQVDDYLEVEDPYIFVQSTKEDLSFQGVRIYKIGSNWAYRIQNEKETQPYGKAYPLNLEEMFEQLISDHSEDETGDILSNALVNEFENFFNKSSKIQSQLGSFVITKSDMSNQLVVSSNIGDFSNKIN